MNDDLYSSAGVAGRYVFSPQTNSKDRSIDDDLVTGPRSRKKAKGGSLDHWTLEEARRRRALSMAAALSRAGAVRPARAPPRGAPPRRYAAARARARSRALAPVANPRNPTTKPTPRRARAGRRRPRPSVSAFRSRHNDFGPLERAYRWLEDHDLARRSLITVFAVLLSRICFLLPLPGLDRRFLHGVLDAGPLGAMKDPFGDLLQTPGNVFQLGFGAMVFSSIVVQVLVSVVPSLKQKTREGGTGEAFIKNLTLYIFAAAAVVQGCLTAGLLQPYLLRGTFAGLLVNLVAGAMILKTACTLIDNHGVGDGFLNVLVANIAAEYAVVVRHVLAKFAQGLVAPAHLLGLVASVCVCVLASVWLTGERERERERRPPRCRPRRTSRR